MTLTVTLPPELETLLQRKVREEGFDPSAFLVQALSERLHYSGPSTLPLSPEETTLLREINQPIPGEIWERFTILERKQDTEKLTEEERSEFIQLTNSIELLDARRLELLGDLARKRGVSLPILMAERGIPSRRRQKAV